ncbi:alcohol dehydrogenase catalytic domain-containing protein, partial [Streptomyces sp. NPDC059956]
MKALVFQGPGRTAWQEVPDPAIKDPADVIVRVDAVTICGTDLHIVKGDLPEVTPGRVLGHEAVGTVVECGGDVRSVRPGDRVLVSCISSCGRCRLCRESRYGQCRGGGGWVLGHTIDGTQADAVVNAAEEPEMLVGDLTDGLGADVVMEAVGVPETFEMCTRMVRPARPDSTSSAPVPGSDSSCSPPRSPPRALQQPSSPAPGACRGRACSSSP